MKFAAAVVLLILLVPAVSAVSILLPPEITGSSNLHLYYNESTTLKFNVRGDAVEKNVTFFIQSASTAVTVGNLSLTFPLSNYSVKSIGVNLFGHDVSSSPVTITYGVRYSNPSSGGIGFENVNSAIFNVDVLCRTSNCNQSAPYVAPYVPPVEQASSGGGGGGGGGSGYYPGSSYLPNGPSTNATNSTPITTSSTPKSSTPPSSSSNAPVVQDAAADSGIAQATTANPSPILTNSNAPKTIAAATVMAGKSVAIALLALLVTLLVMEITLVKVVKTGGVEI